MVCSQDFSFEIRFSLYLNETHIASIINEKVDLIIHSFICPVIGLNYPVDSAYAII